MMLELEWNMAEGCAGAVDSIHSFEMDCTLRMHIQQYVWRHMDRLRNCYCVV
jgi:hypothetical protein